MSFKHENQSLSFVLVSENFEFDNETHFVDFNSNSKNLFKEPFEELWKKVFGTTLYFLQAILGLIPFTLAIFERDGYGGHFRTVLNQLTSWKYMIVSD